MISMLDLGWAAGFIEGEGTFNKSNIGVYATQVNPEPLLKMQRLFGGTIYQALRKRKTGSSLINIWCVHGPQAVGLMFTLWALMSDKRRGQIEVVLRTWKKRPGRNYRLLTEDQIREIRRTTGLKTAAQWARELNVGPHVVRRARNGKVRRDVV